MKLTTLFTASFSLLAGAPIKEIPADLYDEFTDSGKIPVYEWYCDDSYSSDKPIFWSTETINKNLIKASQGQTCYYGPTDTWLYQALNKYGQSLKGKKIAIIGSVTPWYESIVLYYGAKPVTIEYNSIECEDPRLEIYTVEEFEKNRQTFDAIISISSLEHDGLGRYGDKVNPNADLETMANLKTWLNPHGLLFLAVPVCKDSIMFNAHRTYGPSRLPKLLKGYETIESFGFKQSDFEVDPRIEHGNGWYHQPIFVLKVQEQVK